MDQRCDSCARLWDALFLWLNLKWTRLTLSQLSLAADIQRGLLPPVPSDAEGVRWAARLEQAGRIGGDLYDFVRADARSWLVLVGECLERVYPPLWYWPRFERCSG